MERIGNPGGTQIWGDGDTSNGAPPGISSDLIDAGTVITLTSVVPTDNLAAIDFDGRDKFAATKTIAVTRTSWASGSETLFAGCVEVFDTNNWGTEYQVPVGTDLDDAFDYQMFEYTSLSISAGEGGLLSASTATTTETSRTLARSSTRSCLRARC